MSTDTDRHPIETLDVPRGLIRIVDWLGGATIAFGLALFYFTAVSLMHQNNPPTLADPVFLLTDLFVKSIPPLLGGAFAIDRLLRYFTEMEPDMWSVVKATVGVFSIAFAAAVLAIEIGGF